MELTASAPGKLFLAGEYAVTRGGRAVLAAVTRRVFCHAFAGSGSGRLHLSSGDVECELALSAEPADAPTELRFASSAALLVARRLGLHAQRIALRTASELDDGEAKTGLGGSAAVTAAVVAALHGLAGRPVTAGSAAERVADGIAAHRLAQRGGSAADVVAATVGGIVAVGGLDAREVPDDVAAARGATRALRVSWQRLGLPPGVALEAVFSGRSAATAPRAERFGRALDAAAGDGIIRWVDGMDDCAARLAAALASADAAAARGAVEQAGELLAVLEPLAGIAVTTGELARAVAIAREHGAAAKPSGAGGGDCAIALVPAARVEALREAWRRAGLRPLGLDVDPDGARIDAPATPEARRHG